MPTLYKKDIHGDLVNGKEVVDKWLFSKCIILLCQFTFNDFVLI